MAGNFVGNTFGTWNVLGWSGTDLYKCKCGLCGFERDIRGYYLKRKPPQCSCQKNDILHKKFGDLEVIEKLDDGIVKCKCSCGNVITVHRRYLQNGSKKSCGHEKTGSTSKLIDITGKDFGNWHVDQYYGNKLWYCTCTICGREKRIRGHLLRGNPPNCVCQTQEIIANKNLEKYGVRSLKQLNCGRTPEQIELYSSKENLGAVIDKLTVDGKRPTVREVSEYLHLDATSTIRFIRKYKLDDKVQIGVYRSHYETDLEKMFPCKHISDRSVLHGMEIDLYYPEQKFGIEFNGDYWHSELQKDTLYHQRKSLMASKAGVHLVQIFEYEWKSDKMRDKLVYLLGKSINVNSDSIIHARDCSVVYVGKEAADIFLDAYHLQGTAPASTRIGLLYKDELVGLMTFGKPRFSSDYDSEIIRLAFKQGVTVVGGAERMFAHYINEADVKTVISYCDMSKFTGNVYMNLGFKLAGISHPNYKWVNILNGNVLTRYQTMKSTLVEKGLGTENQTEDEIMHGLNFYKVYDCGNYVFSYIKKD